MTRFFQFAAIIVAVFGAGCQTSGGEAEKEQMNEVLKEEEQRQKYQPEYPGN